MRGAQERHTSARGEAHIQVRGSWQPPKQAGSQAGVAAACWRDRQARAERALPVRPWVLACSANGASQRVHAPFIQTPPPPPPPTPTTTTHTHTFLPSPRLTTEYPGSKGFLHSGTRHARLPCLCCGCCGSGCCGCCPAAAAAADAGAADAAVRSVRARFRGRSTEPLQLLSLLPALSLVLGIACSSGEWLARGMAIPARGGGSGRRQPVTCRRHRPAPPRRHPSLLPPLWGLPSITTQAHAPSTGRNRVAAAGAGISRPGAGCRTGSMRKESLASTVEEQGFVRDSSGTPSPCGRGLSPLAAGVEPHQGSTCTIPTHITALAQSCSQPARVAGGTAAEETLPRHRVQCSACPLEARQQPRMCICSS